MIQITTNTAGGFTIDREPLLNVKFCTNLPIAIQRNHETARGYIANLSGRYSRVFYMLADNRRTVGPELDFVPPMGVKEIGASRNIIWMVEAA